VSEPKEQQQEPDGLLVEAETVTDLEPREEDASLVRGGPNGAAPSGGNGLCPTPRPN